MEWTLWDRFDVDLGRDITLAEFLEHFKSKYKVSQTLTAGAAAPSSLLIPCLSIVSCVS